VVHAAQDDALHTLGHGRQPHVFSSAPDVPLPVHAPGVDQRADHLLDQEGVALGLAQNQLSHREGQGW